MGVIADSFRATIAAMREQDERSAALTADCIDRANRLIADLGAMDRDDPCEDDIPE